MTGPLSNTSPPVGGRYQVTEWIGAGGMQHVYKATDTLFRRDVALKVPQDGASTKRFHNSAVVSARINNANVAKTLDYLTETDRSYLIEEFIEGLDLSKIVPKYLPYLPPSACARILHQLAKGLAASHLAGVVHRDLKPSNIMILGGPKFSEVKITDFGIARMAEEEIGAWADTDDRSSTSSKTVLGAIPYMAPESIENFKKSSFPADVWAVAAIVYELLSGKKPFGGKLMNIPDILKAEPPPAPAFISALQFKDLGQELYSIILECLQRDSTKRPTAAQLVRRCEDLTYSAATFELGTISTKLAASLGFISADKGRDLSWHRESFYGSTQVRIGDRVWFARTPGQGNDRAFPIVKVRLPSSE